MPPRFFGSSPDCAEAGTRTASPWWPGCWAGRLWTLRPVQSVESEKSTGSGRGRSLLGGFRAKALASDGAAAPWGSGASLGSAVHGSDERAQHIRVLLAPDPQGTTSSGGVEGVASIGGKRSLGTRTFVERGLPRCFRPVTAKAAGQAPLYEGRQSRRDSGPAKAPMPGTKPHPQRAGKTR